MQVRYKLIRGNLGTTWDQLFAEAAKFATRVGPDRVINVSHAVAADDGTVMVWYWSDEADRDD